MSTTKKMMSVIRTRDEIIDNMLEEGLDPYFNGLGLDIGTYNLKEIFYRNIDEGVKEVKKNKKMHPNRI